MVIKVAAMCIYSSYFGLLKMCPYWEQARPTVGVYTIGINRSISSCNTL